MVAVEHRDAPPPAVLSAKPANQERWLPQARIIPGQNVTDRPGWFCGAHPSNAVAQSAQLRGDPRGHAARIRTNGPADRLMSGWLNGAGSATGSTRPRGSATRRLLPADRLPSTGHAQQRRPTPPTVGPPTPRRRSPSRYESRPVAYDDRERVRALADLEGDVASVATD